MVWKIAGYKLTFEQARAWLHKEGVPHAEYEDSEVGLLLKDLFAQKNIQYTYTVTTGYPEPDAAVIILVRRHGNDKYSTAYSVKPSKERPIDRRVKRELLKETGMNHRDLKWVTVGDPFYRAR